MDILDILDRGLHQNKINYFFESLIFLIMDIPHFPKCLKTPVFVSKFCIFYFSIKECPPCPLCPLTNEQGETLYHDLQKQTGKNKIMVLDDLTVGKKGGLLLEKANQYPRDVRVVQR